MHYVCYIHCEEGIYNWRCAFRPTIISASLSAELEPWRRFASSLLHSRRFGPGVKGQANMRCVTSLDIRHTADLRTSIDFKIPGREMERWSFFSENIFLPFLELKLQRDNRETFVIPVSVIRYREIILILKISH